MVGIRSIGVHIPKYRLERRKITEAMGGASMGGEKAIANSDEDSITMAVEAARNALRGIDASTIDTLFFASTTAPYKDKLSSATVALGADLNADIFTSDFDHSMRAGASALSLAIDRIKGGSSRDVLIAASDCRFGIGGSEFEQVFGDGGAALVVSDKDVIATYKGSYTLNDEFLDVWRTSADTFVSSWEDRFIKTKGYEENVIKVVKGMMATYNLTPSDIQKVVISIPDLRTLQGIGKRLGFDNNQLQDPMLSKVGYTGAAHPLLMLAAAIEEAKRDDQILLVAYGDGCQGFLFFHNR
ncbi:MAG: 3-oxoacyl-[acyl-carrier-protein] synthase III C-terminal domain-containing protein [Pseudomonadota bacterium]